MKISPISRRKRETSRGGFSGERIDFVISAANIMSQPIHPTEWQFLGGPSLAGHWQKLPDWLRFSAIVVLGMHIVLFLFSAVFFLAGV